MYHRQTHANLVDIKSCVFEVSVHSVSLDQCFSLEFNIQIYFMRNLQTYQNLKAEEKKPIIFSSIHSFFHLLSITTNPLQDGAGWSLIPAKNVHNVVG